MSDWDSSQYLKFQQQRTQPAVDLATRVAQTHRPKTAVDIGCGPGNSTAVLQKAFPTAAVTGVDLSPNMVERARAEHPELTFCLGDAATLEGRYDLLFSNACLQWIPRHETLLPRLMDRLNDNGVLAVQIPRNGDEPLFRLIRELAAEPEWGLQNVELPPNETLMPSQYADILTDCSSSFDMWETTYYHDLPDHRALVEWVKGTRLRPYLEYLGEARGAAFERKLEECSRALYPVTRGGTVLLGFRRLFFMAVK